MSVSTLILYNFDFLGENLRNRDTSTFITQLGVLVLRFRNPVVDLSDNCP